MGMTGNQDRAERATTRLAQLHERLDPLLDRAVEALESTPLKAGDTLAVQRFVRGLELVARAARTVVGLQCARFRDGPAGPREEDDMDDDERDDSPETLDRLRAELESRLDGLRTTIERKRLAGWTVVRTGAGGAEENAGAA